MFELFYHITDIESFYNDTIRLSFITYKDNQDYF